MGANFPGTPMHGVLRAPRTGYHIELANVGTLEANSPVMIDDVVVGTVDRIAVRGRHAQADISVEHGVVVPANTVASVGQTSLLGSMHLQLGAPLGQLPQGASGSSEPSSTISTISSISGRARSAT